MRTTLFGLALGAIVLFGAGLSAETKTITGSLIDTQCHLKQGAEKATAAGHADCAAACAKKGVPLVVISGSDAYYVTGDWTANKNEKLIEFAGKKVVATGNVTEKDGKTSIDIASIKVASN